MKMKYLILSLFVMSCFGLLGGTTACSTDDPEPPIETPAGPGNNNNGNSNNEGNNSGESEEPGNMDNMKVQIKIGATLFTATLHDNATATAFKAMLPLTVNMSELNRNEKYYNFSGSLPTAAIRPGTIHSGDLMLYGSNYLVLFYKTFTSSYSYTPIGTIDNPAGLETAVGTGSITITFE